MLTKIKNLSKITTILKVVICILFVFFSSCSKFEEEQNQTTVVPNINETQAIIGKENAYEKYVNIEDFKNSIMEDFETYQKHLKAQEKLLSYETFPNAKSEKDMERISEELVMNYDHEWYDNRSYEFTGANCYFNHNNYIFKKTEPFVEIFYKERYEYKENKYYYRVFLPKELDTLRKELREEVQKVSRPPFKRREVPVSLYCSLTGIPKEIFKDLRVTTRLDEANSYYEINCWWYYQMPYKDNYKDYQNDTKKFYYLDDLKRFIKKGSMIFVFDEPLEELYKDRFIGWGNWGHMLIVGDWYIKETEKYKPLKEYQKLKRDENFANIPYLYKEVRDDKVSFAEYLKHFVFIEAQNGAEIYPNNNNEDGFTHHIFTVRTSGNDKSFQMKISKYTCVAVVNVNEGITYSKPDLIENMIKNADRQVRKEYNSRPTGLDNDTLTHYCSGLAYYSLLNERKTPSLRLLKYEHTSTNPLVNNYKWFMPRTVCNSPFVYTRVWYNKW